MIGYVTLGTNNFEAAVKFYDALLSELGGSRFMDTETFVAWTASAGLAIAKPFDEKPASVGNGLMVALQADSPEHVAHIHARALELGGTDERAPGPRSELPGFHAGYFRDLDGSKLNAFYMESPPA